MDPVWIQHQVTLCVVLTQRKRSKETLLSMKRLQLEKTEQLVLWDPLSLYHIQENHSPPKPFSISPLSEDSVFVESIMPSSTLGFLFMLPEDDHSECSVSLCPPIIVINGSSQEDKPGWPIISGPQWLVKWLGCETCELNGKHCELLHSLKQMTGWWDWSHGLMRWEWNGNSRAVRRATREKRLGL